MSPKKNIHKVIPPNPGNPFRVPEGYFDDVQKRVMERIRSEEQEQIRLEEQEQVRSDEQKQVRPEEQEQIRSEEQKQVRPEEQEQIRSEEQKRVRPEKQEQEGSLQLSGMEHNAGSTKRAGQAAPEQPGKKAAGRRKIYLQPYISLAAAITGVALVVYIVLQSVMGNRAGETNPYDIATLDRAGIIHDEAILADAYAEEEEATTYSEWDEEAIVYLASNEVDLLELIDTN